ncbi:DUF308 domain-containing protein [Bradyrhizobium sp.]|jgi:hypothetical protein|uniref:DUF308 domain-containing protein n=1 Tax=Bradyrhizobium sp. TaxID=376 RepID=UPI003C267C52
MLAVLLIAGIALLSAGLVAIGYGIPVKEFSFGNTLIFSGTLVACTGMIILAQWMVVRELRTIARQFARGNPTIDLGNGLDHEPEEDHGLVFGRDQPAAQSLATPPWRDEGPPPERGRQNIPAGEIEPSSKQRRNLLFSSSRKERERTQGRTTELPAALRTAPPDAAHSAESDDLAPRAFEDTWPKPERSRTPDAPPRRSGRAPTRFAAASAGAAGPAAERNEDWPPITVLKSGVVDGMAYSLYSDGSIEAQLPEGMMRFASIEELRSHLDQRS